MRRTVRRPTPAWEVRIFQAGGCSLFFVMLRHVKKVKARLRDPASWLLLRGELTQPSLPPFICLYTHSRSAEQRVTSVARSLTSTFFGLQDEDL